MSCLGTTKLIDIYRLLGNVPNSDIMGRIDIERPEQELIAKYLPTQCNVLELGGESGTTSLIINNILDDDYKKKHIIIDPEKNAIIKLEYTKNKYSANFQIIHGFLGKNREMHEKMWNGCKNNKMFQLTEIEAMINDTFDVLVIDCEGAFYNIVNEIPEILDKASLIIIEMDGDCENVESLRNKILKSGFTLIHSQCHPYINNNKIVTSPFGVFKTVNDLKKLKAHANLIGFHEVYTRLDI